MTDPNIIKNISIEPSEDIQRAMEQMDLIDGKLLLVMNNSKFISLISIGDIQRAILRGYNLNTPIGKILRKNIKVASSGDSSDKIKAQMKKHRMEFVPILDLDGSLIEIVFWKDVIEESEAHFEENINIPVIIMAGGKGSRLQPITNIIPKPLIPIGDKPILEWIIDSFNRVGVKDFYLTVNYKQEMIRSYFKNVKERNYNLHYFVESKPLGTAGSLNLLKNKIHECFFVSNCDIMVRDNYSEMLKYHKKNKNELTAISVVKNYKIPYGTLEFGDEGLLMKLLEKPELNFFINAGLYILEPHLLQEIPDNKFFHITTLIEKIIKRNGRVGVFPVSEGSWMDVGQWDEYNKTSKKLGFPGINLNN